MSPHCSLAGGRQDAEQHVCGGEIRFHELPMHHRSDFDAQDPANRRMRVTLNSRSSTLSVPGGLAPWYAIAVFVGSMAPACAAIFGEGTRLPTIRTFRHTNAFTLD